MISWFFAAFLAKSVSVVNQAWVELTVPAALVHMKHVSPPVH